ncbi:hypothetical protein ACOSP7_024856 [Xanthoceras sorbifolium]
MAFVVKTDAFKSHSYGTGQFSTPNSRGSKGQKKERPSCSHCKFLGHTIDRCFKIHGYSPGYKRKTKDSFTTVVHQVTAAATQLDHAASFGGFVQNLNPNQYQQFLSLFFQHLTSSSPTSNDQEVAHTSYPTGICFSVSLNTAFSSAHLWIVDSGATRHICSQSAAFVSLQPIQHATVTLPNQTKIPVHFSGNVRLSHDFVLQYVLFVPQFQIYLISVSALVSDSSLTIQFLTHCCIIQDIHTRRMIGKGDKVEGLYVLNSQLSAFQFCF